MFRGEKGGRQKWHIVTLRGGGGRQQWQKVTFASIVFFIREVFFLPWKFRVSKYSRTLSTFLWHCFGNHNGLPRKCRGHFSKIASGTFLVLRPIGKSDFHGHFRGVRKLQFLGAIHIIPTHLDNGGGGWGGVCQISMNIIGGRVA